VRYEDSQPYLHNLTTGQVLEITTDTGTVVGSIEYRVNTLVGESEAPAGNEEVLLDFSRKVEENVYAHQFKGKTAAPGFTEDFLAVRKKLLDTPEGIETYLTDGSTCQPISSQFQLGDVNYRIIGLYEENKDAVKDWSCSMATKAMLWCESITGGW